MNIINQIFGWILAIFFVFVLAVITGTILWILYPVVVPAVFPKIVADGYIAGEISWVTSVLLFWLIGIFRTKSK